MLPFELIAAAYFAVLGLAATAAPVPWSRRWLVMLVSVALSAGVTAVALHGWPVVRAWVPHVYLVAGYWVPGLLAPRPDRGTPFESWLAAMDARVRPRLRGLPELLGHVTELAYLLCYPLVPAAFIIVWTAGTQSDVARFWAAVLMAGYACYVTLPWLVSRPPRLVTRGEVRGLGVVNAFVLGRVSHRLNTFPSGHVAVSLAAAGALWLVSPAASLVVGTVAAAVGVGAIAGRYHYVVDVWAGVAVAAAALVAAHLV